MNLNPYRRGTQLHAISALLLEGKSREVIFREIYPLVIAQREPFVFSNNVNGKRVPKDMRDQINLAFWAIGNTRNSLIKETAKRGYEVQGNLAYESSTDRRNYGDSRDGKIWRSRFIASVKAELSGETTEKTPDNLTPNISTISEPVTEVEDNEPEVIEDNSLRGKLTYLHRRLCELRAFVQSKKAGGREFDYISTRAFVYGKAAVIAGIEPNDFLWSIGASWDSDTKRAAGLDYSVDYAKYSIPDTPLLLGFLVKMVNARIPLYLCGPTGSGKSVLARKLAEYLEMNYGEIPLSLGVSRTDLFGNWNAKGFVNRPFSEIYRNGGVYCFEEIDAADPNILLAVNNAIANESLFNTSNGEEIAKHCDFVALATANTWGNGATANYGGREGLDGSTIDRFKYGRIYVDYNTDLESEIMFSNIDELEKAVA